MLLFFAIIRPSDGIPLAMFLTHDEAKRWQSENFPTFDIVPYRIEHSQ